MTDVRRFLYYIFILFPFVQQRTYEEIPIFATIYMRWFLVSSAIIFFDVFFHGNSFKKDFSVRCVLVFCGLYIFSSLLNFQQGSFRSVELVFGFCMSFLFVLKHSRLHLNVILSSLSSIYGFFIVANFILFILFPNGLYSISHSTHHNSMLLGDDNAVIYVALPGLICLVCNSLQKYNRISMFVWFCLLSTLLTLLLLWAASGMICVALFILFLILHSFFEKKTPFLFFAVVLSAIFVCLFFLSVPAISNFIEFYLEKDASLSGRTYLWAHSFAFIAQKPILGWGGYFLNGVFELTPTISYPCHTQYLQMIIDGGFVLFASYILLIVFLFSELQKNYEKKSAYVLAVGLSFMMVNYITEWSPHHHFFIIAALISSLTYFKKDRIQIVPRKKQ